MKVKDLLFFSEDLLKKLHDFGIKIDDYQYVNLLNDYEKMKGEDSSGELRRITPWKKGEVEAMLTEAGVQLENDNIYDAVYVANMCKADYFGSSIEDKKHVAKYIKDTLDDEDAADGEVFECFLAKCDRRGVRVDWEDML